MANEDTPQPAASNDPPDTIESELARDYEVFAKARHVCQGLPAHPDSGVVPTTFQDALNIVAKREEEKRKHASSKESKSKKGMSDKLSLAGAQPGMDPDASAFWMVMEGFCRDVTAQDLQLLLPPYLDPRMDPAFHVPYVGASRSDADAPPTPRVEGAPQSDFQQQDGDEGRRSSRISTKTIVRDGALPSSARRERPTSSPPSEPPPTNKPAILLDGYPLTALVPCLHTLLCLNPPPLDADGSQDSFTASDISAILLGDVGPNMRARVQDFLQRCVNAELAEGAAAEAGQDGASNGSDAAAKAVEGARLTANGLCLLGPRGEQGGPPAAAQTREEVQSLLQASANEVAARLSRQLPNLDTAARTGMALEGAQTKGPSIQPGADAAALIRRPPVDEFIHPFLEMFLSRTPTDFMHHIHVSAEQAPLARGPSEEALQDLDEEAPTPSASAGGPPQEFGLQKMSSSDALEEMAALLEGGRPASADADGNGARPPGDAAASKELGGKRSSDGGKKRDSDARESRKRGSGAIDYSILAGKRSSAPGMGPPRKRQRNAGWASEPSTSNSGAIQTVEPITAAIAACVAEGAPEGSADEQWALLNANLGMLVVAPEDEILAEIISLQTELAQVAAVNRRRQASLLETVLEKIPEEQAQAAKRRKAHEDIVNYLTATRDLKRAAKNERRESDRRRVLQALADVDGADGGAARVTKRGSQRRSAALAAAALVDNGDSDDSDFAGVNQQLPLRGDDLSDPYSFPTDPMSALCAVCGDGTSHPTNEIVFCERCNIAVHQRCYGIDAIPEGDWLCWPCVRYEQDLLAKGHPMAEVRAPRYTLANNAEPDYPGGAKDVVCALCPIKRGIFKQTADGRRWVHMNCALWQQPEVVVDWVNIPNAIRGVDKIPPERRNVRCAYCAQTTGAAVKCAAQACHKQFHPLCARRAGCFAVCRHSAGRGRPAYRSWCLEHSEAARRREASAASHAGEEAPTASKSRGGGGKDGWGAAAAAGADLGDRAALDAKLVERDVLNAVRLDLETLRIIVAQVEKREKTKRAIAKTQLELYEKYEQNPAAAAQHVFGPAAAPRGAAGPLDAPPSAHLLANGDASAPMDLAFSGPTSSDALADMFLSGAPIGSGDAFSRHLGHLGSTGLGSGGLGSSGALGSGGYDLFQSLGSLGESSMPPQPAQAAMMERFFGPSAVMPGGPAGGLHRGRGEPPALGGADGLSDVLRGPMSGPMMPMGAPAMQEPRSGPLAHQMALQMPLHVSQIGPSPVQTGGPPGRAGSQRAPRGRPKGSGHGSSGLAGDDMDGGGLGGRYGAGSVPGSLAPDSGDVHMGGTRSAGRRDGSGGRSQAGTPHFAPAHSGRQPGRQRSLASLAADSEGASGPPGNGLRSARSSGKNSSIKLMTHAILSSEQARAFNDRAPKGFAYMSQQQQQQQQREQRQRELQLQQQQHAPQPLQQLEGFAGASASGMQVPGRAPGPRGAPVPHGPGALPLSNGMNTAFNDPRDPNNDPFSF